MTWSIKLCTVLTVALGVTAAANAQVSPAGIAPGQKANYAVDGRTLGSRLQSDSSMRDYKCAPSEQFDGFTWCQRSSRETERRGTFEASHSILQAKDGTIVYLSRHQQPAFLDAAAAERDIQKYARSFGESPKITRMPRRPGTTEATIATWGGIELEPLDSDSVKLLAEGKSPKKGFLIDYLGNLTRSAQDGLPIYHLVGGAGFVWAGSFDPRGRGTLRLVAIDASSLRPDPVAAAQPASQPGDKDSAPAAQAVVPQDELPVVARRDTEVTVAQLQSELSSALQEKAELEQARARAEEAERQATGEVEIARKETEEARNAANVAFQEIDRLKRDVAARGSAIPIAVCAAATLLFGFWLGSRAARKRATSPATGDASDGTEVDAVASTDQLDAASPVSATEQPKAVLDEEGLVRELGRELGLEEVSTPLAANLSPSDGPEPVPQPQTAAPPLAVAIPPEPAPLDADAKVDISR
jgi:hypothetical protein